MTNDFHVQSGGSVLSQSGGSVLSQSGGSVLSQSGGSVLSQSGGSVLSQSGGVLSGVFSFCLLSPPLLLQVLGYAVYVSVTAQLSYRSIQTFVCHTVDIWKYPTLCPVEIRVSHS